MWSFTFNTFVLQPLLLLLTADVLSDILTGPEVAVPFVASQVIFFYPYVAVLLVASPVGREDCQPLCCGSPRDLQVMRREEPRPKDLKKSKSNDLRRTEPRQLEPLPSEIHFNLIPIYLQLRKSTFNKY